MSHKFNVETLIQWEQTIKERVDYYNLNVYKQEFEICDHDQMITYMAYSGMPSRYRHWSFGKSFEKTKTMYSYGVSGLPYEMVINSNPCLAYLMRDNSLLLQIMTIAHVYGHNDFFKNNYNFRENIDAKYVLDMFKNNAKRVNSYMQDPSIGIDKVENILDYAHSLNYQKSRYIAYSDDLNQNLLGFIRTYSKSLTDWEKDLLYIVETETQYFMPQMDTKIMNEGWASYWHYKIMNSLNLSEALQLEFIINHNQVLRPTPGSINPYNLGFVLWNEIEKKFNDNLEIDDINSEGRKKIFEIRETDRDESFLRRFLTEDIIRKIHLFQHEKRGEKRIVTKVADENNWEIIKENLIKSTGTNNIPVITVIDYSLDHTLNLAHKYDQRELELNYTEKCLLAIEKLWKDKVTLKTVLNKEDVILTLENNKIKINKVNNSI